MSAPFVTLRPRCGWWRHAWKRITVKGGCAVCGGKR